MFCDLFGNRRAKLGLHIHTNLSDGAVSPEEAATTRTITVIFASTARRVKNRVCQQPPVETVCICGGVWQASHARRRYADADETFLRAFVIDEDGRQAWTNIVRLPLPLHIIKEDGSYVVDDRDEKESGRVEKTAVRDILKKHLRWEKSGVLRMFFVTSLRGCPRDTSWYREYP